jgi:hypothetical protein
MTVFLAGFIVGCFFATGAIFLFCAFGCDPPEFLDAQDDADRQLAHTERPSPSGFDERRHGAAE